MGALFGKSKKPVSRITEQDKAVLQLKQQRDKLKQYQKKIQLCLEKERELAKQLLKNGKKDRALLLLKKKRFQEQILDKTEGQLDNLERLTHDLEFSQVEVQVLEGLKTGNESLKKIHELFTIEEVERIMDETNEGIEKQKEIDELISGSLTEEDEEAVISELDDIIKASLPEVPAAVLKEEEVILPEVPEEEPAKKVKKEKVREKIPLEAS